MGITGATPAPTSVATATPLAPVTEIAPDTALLTAPTPTPVATPVLSVYVKELGPASAFPYRPNSHACRHPGSPGTRNRDDA